MQPPLESEGMKTTPAFLSWFLSSVPSLLFHVLTPNLLAAGGTSFISSLDWKQHFPPSPGISKLGIQTAQHRIDSNRVS